MKLMVHPKYFHIVLTSAYVLILKATVGCNPCTAAYNHYDIIFLARNVALKYKFFTLNIILISKVTNRKDYLTLLCLY